MASISPVPADRESTFQVIPLGGLGEFVMNMLLIVYNETTLLIDAGSMFPGPELPGVDRVIPDLEHLKKRVGHLDAVVLTHGHEDHVGALPYIWPLLNGPVYGTPITLALVEPRLIEHGFTPLDRCSPMHPGDTVAIGELRLEFIQVTHSMPGCVAIALHTPSGTVIHTGDYKFDHTPLDGKTLDIHRFAELGRTGVLALFGDSTNVRRSGFTGSELEVVPELEELFSTTKGKVVIAAFSSSLHRIQIIANLAETFERKLVLLGRRLVQNIEIAQRLGYVQIPSGLQIQDHELKEYDSGRVVCITTGSQGEPLSALARIANNNHRHVTLEQNDTVVFSARAIPSNRRAISRVMNQIARSGARVVDEGMRPVHVSGHGSAEELKLMLALVKPRYFVPIHGEYHCLSEHGRVASQVSGGKAGVLIAEDGDVIHLSPGKARIDRCVDSGRTLIDGTRFGTVENEVIRHRRRLAAEGIVVPVITINRQESRIEGTPNIVTRGVSLDGRTESLIDAMSARVAALVRDATRSERSDSALLSERVRTELQSLLRKQAGRRPLVLPVIMEV